MFMQALQDGRPPVLQRVLSSQSNGTMTGGPVPFAGNLVNQQSMNNPTIYMTAADVTSNFQVFR
jgi:hypothetical protein